MKQRMTYPVTIMHFDEKEKRDFSFHFPKAKVHGATKIGNLHHLRRSQNKYIVRIMTDSEIKVACGDTVTCELFGTLTVTGVSDNRRGSKRVRHYRLDVN